MSKGATLKLQNLARYYENFAAVRGISLDLESGTFLTLLGPSGSGKTTTLMMIAGFTEPSAGEILINGRPVTRVPPHKRDLGMVFQNYALFPHMTVAENVAFPLLMRKMPKSEMDDRVAQFTKMVGLAEFRNRYPSQLSGGQQQRVALARALVFSPSLVLMDEPLGALDRRLRLQMQEEIKSIQCELGLTVIYVTHDQEEALTMSDQIAVMEHGVISSYGSPRQTYEEPTNKFVASFIGESNFIPCEVGPHDGPTASASVLAGGHRVTVHPNGVRAGDSALIFVRPERLRLCNDGEALDNKLPGKVVGQIYLGDASLYRVQLGADLEVRVKRPNRGYGAPVSVGDACHVGWQARDSIVLNA